MSLRNYEKKNAWNIRRYIEDCLIFIQYKTQLFPNRPQFCKLVEIRRNYTVRAINNDPEGSPRVAPMASS